MIKERQGKEHLFHSDTLSNSSLVNSVKARYAHQNNKQLDLKKGDWTTEPRTARVQGSSLHLLCHVQEILSSFLQSCNKGLEQCSFSLLLTLPASVIQVGFLQLERCGRECLRKRKEASISSRCSFTDSLSYQAPQLPPHPRSPKTCRLS